jgi:hypothetical protein
MMPCSPLARPVCWFAAPQSAHAVRLPLELDVPSASGTPPVLTAVVEGGSSQQLQPEPPSGGRARYFLTVPAAADPTRDDRVLATLSADGVSPVHVEFRRSRCVLETALLGGPPAEVLKPDTLAALHWYAWGRFTRLVGVRRFPTARAGSDVFVFRPRLRSPDFPTANPLAPAASNRCPRRGAPGCSSRPARNAHRSEWERFRTFLLNRRTPFLSCSEEYLPVRPVEVVPASPPGRRSPPPGPLKELMPTLVSSFVGGT